MINARSIVNKVDQLEVLLLALSPDIAAIMETWLNSNIHDREIVLPGVVIVRKAV